MEIYFNVPMSEAIAATIQRRARNIEVEKGAHSSNIAKELRLVADEIRNMTIFEILEQREILSETNNLHEKCFQRILLLAQKREEITFHFTTILFELQKEISDRSEIEQVISDLALSNHIVDYKTEIGGRKTRMISIAADSFSHEAMRAAQPLGQGGAA